jgi:hypothetical protein
MTTNSKSLKKSKIVQPKVEKVMIDVQVPTEPRKAIYQITTDSPVEKPYSTTGQWQKILAKYSLDLQPINEEAKPPTPDEEKLAKNIINLENRNWVQE